MKKYVLNIEKLYSGQTSNSLVLKQVDYDFPVLIPCVDDSIVDLDSWISKWQDVYDFFNPPSSHDIDELNDYIMEFNLNLQNEFKNRGHDEVYMMDDTWELRPRYDTFSIDKKYLHSINGKSEVNGENDETTILNSSQLNVIFPFKKIMNKSLYATQLTIDNDMEIDEKLEMSRNITLQGRVSYEKCVQSVANVGNNLYVMSPELELTNGNIYPNGMAIVNGGEQNFVFPNSMTLFQHRPHELHYDEIVDDFREWYNKHDHKVVVDRYEPYGGNISYLTYIGKSSYEIKLATYSPSVDDQTDDIGFMFNLYDTFITGKERIIRMRVPVSRDFNELELKFDCEFVKSDILKEQIQWSVFVNGEDWQKIKTYKIRDASIDNVHIDGFNGQDIDISVMIYYDVDYIKRNSDQEYREALKNSGVRLSNIRIENGMVKEPEHLTFGSYVNEYGISEDERNRRYLQFWQVSQYRKDIAYQTVLESSLRNIGSSRFEYRNNYSTGDMYGDVFVTKSVLDPLYNMTIDDENGLSMPVRDYIGLGSCSNQLSLIYNQATMKFNQTDNGVDVRRKDDYNGMKYQMVEVVKNINRFESSVKHKSNVFSVVVENTNLVENPNSDDDELKQYKQKLRESITQFVRNACQGVVPVHTQLFDVQFT